MLVQDSKSDITQDTQVFKAKFEKGKPHNDAIRRSLKKIVDSCLTEDFPSSWRQRNILGLMRWNCSLKWHSVQSSIHISQFPGNCCKPVLQSQTTSIPTDLDRQVRNFL